MNIATLLLTYNRSWHTQQVLTALKQNTVLPQKLYIFQDGLKKNQDEIEWKKVNRLIYNIDWCDTKVIVAGCNKGVAEMMISGVNYVLQEYDAVIVLEDDCVPMPGFMTFMNQCLKKYADNSKVYSITGYDNLKGMESQSDAYCIGRPSSWGWGTWKNRWSEFKKDYEIVRRLKTTAVGSRNLALWGNDLEDMLVGRVRGFNDAWDVFWALTLIEKGGICIRAGKSLIRNIGFDGTGLHCGKTNAFDTVCTTEVKEKYNLPEVAEGSNRVDCSGGGVLIG